MKWIGGAAAGAAPTALNRAALYEKSNAKRNIMKHEFFESGANKKIGGVWVGAAEFSVELATIKNEAKCATMKNTQTNKCKTNLKN
ncbi:hypothetical protein ACMAZF_15955 [Psychrobium sp. nBUS_13]|jgi:hypothetical protein|uniref:hypothetical protein n=1 Tax=Psychrobium sp. nBUS_13 TaxID=3395319 RepID=UPI003EC01AC8